ncbi:MAG: HtrA protease/chaperone protein [Rhodobiaceae bacterium]|nr:MAG: HtrA protease/chaperone protein [Rhodobiaceae bacterium]
MSKPDTTPASQDRNTDAPHPVQKTKSIFENKGTFAAAIGVAAIIGFGAASLDRPVVAQTSPLALESAVPVSGFANMVARVAPAVVSVQVVQRVAASNSGGRLNIRPGHPRERFFRENPNRNGEAQPQRGPRPQAQGSGFVISEDGYIVTNHHVIENGVEVTVVFSDGREAIAEIVGTDEKTDLALLKIESDEPLPHVAFKQEDDLRVGDWVVAVGNPFGLGGTVTSGIVSARGRDIGAGPYDDFIQIDASINQGNSGGPTFDLSGNVVGVNTAIYSPTGGNVGIGFAIPASVASRVIADLKENGRVQRGWLGVSIQPLGPEIAETLGLAEDEGALIAQVVAGSPAEAAGLRRGDLIRAINGTPMEEPRDVSRAVANLSAGSTARFDLWRDGSLETIEVKIGAFPDEQQVAALTTSPEESVLGGLGLALAESPAGVVIQSVAPASEAAEKGLRPGDVILEIAGHGVGQISDLVADIAKARDADRKSVLILVRSERGQRFVALRLADT